MQTLFTEYGELLIAEEETKTVQRVPANSGLFPVANDALVADNSFNHAPARERRVALEKRRRVADMSPEEMCRELLTSDVTGLPNRRAFEEAGPALAVAMSDVDGLKAVNQYGYDAGNAVLRAMADALREAGLEAYHDKGDEFLCRGSSVQELRAKLERSRTILRDCTIVVERGDGGSLYITGADFSFGVGKDIGEAELGLRNQKAERESAGAIARGELRGITARTDNARIFISTVEAPFPECLDLP